MKHLDLFSGIGGFAYAADQVWPGIEHLFCDKEPFCRAVLKKHWPESEIYDDIRQLIADAESAGLEGQDAAGGPRAGGRLTEYLTGVDILTGGFPCQSFSNAGARRGTADDRYLWPEMYRVIQLTKPSWVIAENVHGLVAWNGGVVLEQVCADLEASGYEVQPLIIPAAAVGAPHRRDRVWFVACHTGSQELHGGAQPTRQEIPQGRQTGWGENWVEVATELCGVDDGLSARVGGLELTKAQHRVEQIKAYGNAIVPQVAMQIMEAIKKA